MNIHHLEYIIAIAEEKNISQAADRLLVSQPALSRQLKKLENELGTRLFVREKNQMLLTDAGKVYVNGARSILNIYETASDELRRMKVSGRKTITMVYNSALLPIFASEILPAFRKLHEDILLSTIDGNTSVAKEYLTGGMADLAVMATRDFSHSILEYIPLRTEELMLAVPSDHPCIPVFMESGVDFQTLKDEHFILNQTNSYFRMMEQEIFYRCHFPPRILCEIADLNASRNMVANHRGIAFLPKSMKEAAEEQKTAEGIQYFSLNPPAMFHVVIAYHKDVPPASAVRDLIMVMLNAYNRPEA